MIFALELSLAFVRRDDDIVLRCKAIIELLPKCRERVALQRRCPDQKAVCVEPFLSQETTPQQKITQSFPSEMSVKNYAYRWVQACPCYRSQCTAVELSLTAGTQQ